MPFRQDVSERWHQNVQISREQVFGDLDKKCRPNDPTDDAETMFAGYVGKDYVPGGCMLLAINPGGGGAAKNSRADDEFYTLLKNFKNGGSDDMKRQFEAINVAFVDIVRSWNLWTVLGPTIEAAGRKLNHVAYLNAVPYRTLDDKKPPAAARLNGWEKIIVPSLALLKPSQIIAIGKTVHDQVLDRFYNGDASTYCIPRMRGDRALHKDAYEEFERLRTERSQP